MDEMLTTEATEETEVTEVTEETEVAEETTTEEPTKEAPPAVDTQSYRDGAFRDILAGMNVLNPKTQQPFQNEREWNEYLTDFQEQERRKELQNNNIDPDYFNDAVKKAVESNPTVQQAEVVIRQATLERGRQLVEAELAEIRKYDPSIKTLDDIFAHPKFREMDEMRSRGYSILDSYKLANFDTISQKRVDAARQGTMNQMAGKAHLTTTKGNVGDTTVVPAETLATYRQWFPGKSDEWYAKQFKKFG